MKGIGGLITGGVWKAAPVGEQPSLTLVCWQVMQLPSGDRHFIGYGLQNEKGRAGAAGATFDVESLRGVTASGPVYELSGRQGHDSDAGYVWRACARINAAHEWTHVTAAGRAAHLEACTRAAEDERERP